MQGLSRKRQSFFNCATGGCTILNCERMRAQFRIVIQFPMCYTVHELDISN